MAAKAAKKTVAKSRAPKAADSRAADSREEILAVATEEFAERGLSGARVDAIAERTRTSKRMIYYHFSGKEGLYKAVLERVYSEIRTVESQLDLDALTPVEAMQRMVELTFDYDENHPNFIRLVAVENINQGDSLKRLGTVRKRYSHVIEVLKSIL